jgi:LysM domain
MRLEILSLIFFMKYKIICSLIISLLLTFNTAYAIEYTGTGGIPAYPREDNYRSKEIFVHTSEPGAIIEDGITVTNNSDNVKTLYIYSTDKAKTGDSGFACTQRAEINQELGSWIKLGKTEVTLQPNTYTVIPFTISVPQDIDVGEHNGCISIEEKKEISREETAGGVSLSTRVSLRVAITIPGDIVKNLEIINFTSESKESGKELITIKAKNNGNVSIETDVQLKIYNIFGKLIETYGGVYPIMREKYGEWLFSIKRNSIWGGFYKGTLALEYDEDPTSEIGIENDNPKTRLEGGSIIFFQPPSIIGLFIEIIVFLCILSGIILGIVSIKRKHWIKTHWVPYKIQEGDEIKDLAKKFNVSWKILAKANDLEPPYSLHELKTILAPPPKKNDTEK